jgi:ABC-type glycerol-3-phosphate transport system permease component
MPISGPTVATAALMLFILQWDAFFWPLVAASAPDYVVIQVAIARNVSFEQTDWGQMFASASVAVLIAMLPFLALQRFYVRTIMQSGLK